MDTCHSLLPSAENLKKWVLAVPSRPHPTPTGVHHRRLVNLDLLRTTQIGGILSILTLPSPQHLFLWHLASWWSCEKTDKGLQLSIMSFLQRSSPPLLTLSICLETPPDPDDFFIGCLDYLPSLAVFHINTTIENDTLVGDSLIPRLKIEYPGFVAPNLERLALGEPVMFTSESFLAMVASRRHFATARACSAIDHERISRRLAGAPNQESIIDLYF